MLQSITATPLAIREPRLRARGISATYPGGIRALDRVSLTIPAGVYGLVGPRGSGKSTLLRILSGAQQPDDGSISTEGTPDVIVFDDPAAGLGATERARLLDHLTNLGDGHTVILATTSIEDVADVCTHMAILDKGEVLVEYDPESAINQIRGRIWSRVVAGEEVPALRRSHAVIATERCDTRIRVRVYADTASLAGFDRVAPDLEDVYSCALAGHYPSRG
ncbi:MAG: ATP-binding cassette domain-containing protein [Cyanobacteria bacterium]|nr:ATP-binding cassette domain-containing protein [Cyanobacteriota bacterium]